MIYFWYTLAHLKHSVQGWVVPLKSPWKKVYPRESRNEWWKCTRPSNFPCFDDDPPVQEYKKLCPRRSKWMQFFYLGTLCIHRLRKILWCKGILFLTSQKTCISPGKSICSHCAARYAFIWLWVIMSLHYKWFQLPLMHVNPFKSFFITGRIKKNAC